MIYEFEDKVLEYAAACHGEQKRKYTGEPYINHPIEVAEIIKSIPHIEHREAMVYSALLHDVIEDTNTKPYELYAVLTEIGLSKELSAEVTNNVIGLSDISKLTDGNRAVRKAMDTAHLATKSKEIKTVKLADIISNTKSIIDGDKDFARVYIPEMIEKLRVLKEGDFSLYMRACYEVYKAKIELEYTVKVIPSGR